MENKDDGNIIIIVVYLLDEESGEIALVINCYTIQRKVFRRFLSGKSKGGKHDGRIRKRNCTAYKGL